MPGIVYASRDLLLDVHWGYGFPIGGVAATQVEDDGVVPPGGVGFDVSCGVRLLVVHDRDHDGALPSTPCVWGTASRETSTGARTAGASTGPT